VTAWNANKSHNKKINAGRRKSTPTGYLRCYLLKMNKTILILICLFSLTCCHSDVVTKKYETYQEAVADDIFQKGWLPVNIPESSRNFVLNNNLDLNASFGEFTIDLKKTKDFIVQLIAIDKGENDYEQYKYSYQNLVWVFKINTKNGHVKYTLNLENK
jgi:hypothetical protein